MAEEGAADSTSHARVPRARHAVVLFSIEVRIGNTRLGTPALARGQFLRERFQFVFRLRLSAAYCRGAWRGSRSFFEKNVCSTSLWMRNSHASARVARSRKCAASASSSLTRSSDARNWKESLWARSRARAQSSFAISAAFCSKATMVRPDSSATTSGCCPFGVGANGTTVAALSGAYALIATHSNTANVGYRSECSTASIERPRKFMRERDYGWRMAANAQKKKGFATEHGDYPRDHTRGLLSGRGWRAHLTPRLALDCRRVSAVTSRRQEACRLNAGSRRRSRGLKRWDPDPSAPGRCRAPPSRAW